MNKIQVFKSEQFGAIRTMVMPDGQIGFVGKDVAEVLGYTNASKAVMMHVDEEDRMSLQLASDSQNGNPWRSVKTTFISESGLYSLVLSSKLPADRQFKRWVTSEVLPQIRQTGGYLPVREEESAETIFSNALQIIERTVKLQREELEQKSDALGSWRPWPTSGCERLDLRLAARRVRPGRCPSRQGTRQHAQRHQADGQELVPERPVHLAGVRTVQEGVMSVMSVRCHECRLRFDHS